MEHFYNKLFSSYGESILLDADCGYDEEQLEECLKELPLDPPTRRKIQDLLFKYYYHWSANAFTVGLHLGLSLLNDEVRRLRPQKV